jgi:hypothetical protein
MTEVVFFHRASRSVVLTDLIENFELNKLDSWWTRWLARLGGVLDPDGKKPRDMRLTFPKAELRKAVEVMLGWEPERILLRTANGMNNQRRTNCVGLFGGPCGKNQSPKFYPTLSHVLAESFRHKRIETLPLKNGPRAELESLRFEFGDVP